MSDEKTCTEREKVLAQRAAWVAGFVSLNECDCDDTQLAGCERCVAYGEAVGRSRYPLPKVTRPRELVWGGNTYRWTPLLGLQVRISERVWTSLDGISILENHRVVIADLLANPTEEVDAE